MNNAKCKYCTYSQGECDPMKMVSFLLCGLINKIVDADDVCESFEREPGRDDGDK